jgi:hypothetical protein
VAPSDGSVGVGHSSGMTTQRDGEKDGAATAPTRQHLQRLENGGATRLRSSVQRSSGRGRGVAAPMHSSLTRVATRWRTGMAAAARGPA